MDFTEAAAAWANKEIELQQAQAKIKELEEIIKKLTPKPDAE